MSQKRQERRAAERAHRKDSPTAESPGRTPPGTPWWHTRALLAALVACFALLAFAALKPTIDFGGDSANYYILGKALAEHGAYVDLHKPGAPIHGQYPPGMGLLAALFMKLGFESIVFFKALIVLLTTAGVAATAAWLRVWAGPGVALWATALLAVSPGLLRLSHLFLSDMPFWAAVAGAIWLAEGARSPRRGMAAAALVVASYLLRSAALPLLIAFGVWTILRRQWSVLAGYLALLAPVVFFWKRYSNQNGGDYSLQFWYKNPYDPSLGSADMSDLALRVAENAAAYFQLHVPTLLFLRTDAGAVAAASLLILLGVAGWALRLRKFGLAELFVPLYLGIVLLWPVVWSGERFFLPVVGFVLGYASWMVAGATERLLPRMSLRVGLATFGLFFLAALPGVQSLVQDGTRCMSEYRTGNVDACQPEPYREFAEAARFAGRTTPSDAVVISRKPSLFYFWGARQSTLYPFSDNPLDFFETARASNATHVLFASVSGTSPRYLLPVLATYPDAFCMAYSSPTSATVLFRILRKEGWEARPVRRSPEGVSFQACS